MEPVTYERRGTAAVVTIDSQERRNAVDGPTAEQLAAAYDRFEADDEARVLIAHRRRRARLLRRRRPEGDRDASSPGSRTRAARSASRA